MMEWDWIGRDGMERDGTGQVRIGYDSIHVG